jgi:hypothetical protein
MNFPKDDFEKVDTQIKVEVHGALRFELGIA